ncbi:AraC family transcriptional regulator [Sphingomonas bacterium]|uniref:AraC family transcriptional regulator n=1 Tax=Sphingomonas bacterium TaxID=1895847 RepID=UPI00157687C1|nr:helix-turn-helix transcriptional regulator [Sphingomonas bacterium]
MRHSNEVLTSGRPVIALQDEYAAGFVDPMHAHDRVQILYASAGVMSVRTPELSFAIPPQRALWLPPGLPHEVCCRGRVSLRTLYIADAADATAPCRVFEVSPFLRALILEVAAFPPFGAPTARCERIIELLLAEIACMPDAPYQVAMPLDPRLLRVCAAILSDPADNRDIDDWIGVAAMGRRTFTRTFKQQTGMGFAVWPQQVRLMEALSQLAAGMPVTQVAFDVGYDSPSSFAAMFRRALGVPPSHYLRH